MSQHSDQPPRGEPRSCPKAYNIPKEVSVTGDLGVTDFEARHLSALRRGQWLFGFVNLQRLRTDSHRLWHTVFRRFDSPISSKVVRNACVLYSLYYHGDMIPNGDELVQSYLISFYQAARDAIARQAFGELVYGCFAACVFALRTKRDLKEAFHHADGFRGSLWGFVAEEVLDVEEMLLLECMWEKMVWYLARAVTFQSHPEPENIAHLESFSQPLSLADYKNAQSSWMEHSFDEVKAKLDFVRVTLVLLKLRLNPDSGRVAEFLSQRFFDDMRMNPIGRPIKRLDTDKEGSSAVITMLWSELFNLTASILTDGERVGESAVGRIFSILNHVPSIGSHRSTRAVDLRLYSLVLAGTHANQRKDLYPQFGLFFIVRS
jgi:hypothetical protein